MAYRRLVCRINEALEAIKCSIYHSRISFESWIAEQQTPFSALLHRYRELVYAIFLEEFGLDARCIVGGRYCWFARPYVGQWYSDGICWLAFSLGEDYFEMLLNFDTPVARSIRLTAIFGDLTGFGFVRRLRSETRLGRGGALVIRHNRLHDWRTSVAIRTLVPFRFTRQPAIPIAILLFTTLVPGRLRRVRLRWLAPVDVLLVASRRRWWNRRRW